MGLVLPQKQQVWVQAFQWQAKTVGRAHGLKIRVSQVTDFSCLDGFSLVIGKTSELLALGDEERLGALRAMDPARLLDPFEAVAAINDRFALAEALRSLEVWSEGGATRVTIPPSVEWDGEKLARRPSFGLPWVCKPKTADGTAASHELLLAYSEEAAAEQLRGGQWQVQPFVAHGGRLVKVYVLGDSIAQQCRPSLPDTIRERPSDGAHFVALRRQQSHHKLADDPIGVEEGALRELVRAVRGRLGGVALFGMDLLRDSETGHFVLVDVNYFPGYYGVSDVFHRITELALARVLARPVLAPSPVLRLGSADAQNSPLLGVAAISDLFAYLCQWLPVGDVSRLSLCCAALFSACNSRAVWTTIARRFASRLDLIPGFARHSRRLTLSAVLPGAWDSCGRRLVQLGRGHQVLSNAIAPEQCWGASVLLSDCSSSFAAIGVTCGGDTGQSLWLPPNQMPCLVLGSGVWRGGSRLPLPEGEAAVLVPAVPARPVLLGVRIEVGLAAHFFVDERYVCSVGVCEAGRPWRVAVGASSGTALVTLIPPPPLPPLSVRLLL